MVKKIAIIVASGSGNRMNAEIPKQFLKIGNRPILVRTIEKFLSVPDCDIIVALSLYGMALWKIYCAEYFEDISRIKFIEGGYTRFQSVKNAINSINLTDAVVAIHDAVRPFVELETILNAFEYAELHGTAVASVDVKDSLRQINKNSTNTAIDRKNVKIIQTPQSFRLDILKKAFDIDYKDIFTDDAAVVEHSNVNIHLIDGSYSNIKITTPEDLALGEILLKQLERKN